MNQLEEKYYSRLEIADLLAVNIKDNRNFKRNVTNTLDKWGYKYEYTTKGVTIISAPREAAARLSEIMVRGFNLDIRLDTISFARFIYAFGEIEAFDAMPWNVREEVMKNVYGVTISERTLRTWANKLIERGLLVKNGEKSKWRTITIDGNKKREWIEGDEEAEEEWRAYWHDFSKLKEEGYSNPIGALIKKYGCCYYSCPGFTLSAFDDEQNELLQEVYELVTELSTTY